MAPERQQFTIRVYDPKAPDYRRDCIITLEYDLQKVANWLGTRAQNSVAGKAMIMEGAIVALDNTGR